MGETLIDGGSVLFIGAGAMGEPMVARVADAGYSTFVADADEARAAQVAGAIGARAVKSVSTDPLDHISTVVLMLPSSPVVDSVLIGESNVLDRLAAGSVVIDMSSSTPACTRDLSERAHARGIGYLDAPVSGGVPKARSGELSIMVGGDAVVFAARLELLSVMGTTISHVGESGSGHAMKALNNLLSAIGLIGAAEVLAVAAKFGIEPRAALDVLNASTGRNQSTEVKYGRYVLSRAFDSGFAMQLMVKDLRIALDIAHDAGVPVPISATALEEWTGAIAALGHRADHTEIAEYVEHRAGVLLTESAEEAASVSSEKG
jgi:3-hydroxyisobutyrate dehydrogenase